MAKKNGKVPEPLKPKVRERMYSDAADRARGMIDEALDGHGVRSARAIANLSGLSISTVYAYRNPQKGRFRMQLPTYFMLKDAATKRYR
jgi:DNA invertase Pin-like site-specific DNA recombinase